MFFFLIFIKLIIIEAKTEKLEVFINNIFNKTYDSGHLYMDHCTQYIRQMLNYKGRPTNIKDIINTKNKEDLSGYKYIYISEFKDLARVVEFPKSTIFLIYNQISEYEIQYKKDYCYINIKWKLEDYGHLYYIIIGKEVNKYLELYVIGILVIFFIISILFLFLKSIKICNLKFYEFLNVYFFGMLVHLISFFLPLSCIFINLCLLTYCIYSFYKTYMIINLFFYVDGYRNLHYDYAHNSIYLKYFLFFFLFESLCSTIFIYIIYFIPAINSYFLLTIKSIIEHIVLLIYTIKCIKKRFMPLYYQYLFEKQLRTILAIGYKAKLIIYSKIIIFSLLYSIGFIILPIIEMSFDIHALAMAFYYRYYINVIFEIFLSFFLSIIFFPAKITVFYYLPIKYDYNSRKIIVNIIKEENKRSNNNISHLTQRLLNKNYKKKELPIVFMKPFSKINNILYKDIILGKIEKNNN